MREQRPDAPVSDVYIVAWTEGYITQQILEQAAANGDMTRAGVVAAANEITADLRASRRIRPRPASPTTTSCASRTCTTSSSTNFTPGGTVSDEDAGTGFELLEGPFVSDVAADFVSREPASRPRLTEVRGVGPRRRPHPATTRPTEWSAPLLDVANVEVVYNDVILVLRGLSIEVPDGQIVALLGANGAGKTTTLRAITGLLDVHEGDITKGTVTYDGADLNDKQPSEIVAGGITQVMEGRRIFAELTVDENLVCGGSPSRTRR